MPTADFLTTIAQVAVSLAGFSGLIAAIRTAAPCEKAQRYSE